MRALHRLGKLTRIWYVVAGCTALTIAAFPTARLNILYKLEATLALLGVRGEEATPDFHMRDPKIGAVLISPENSDLSSNSKLDVVFIGELRKERIPHIRQYFSRKKHYLGQQICIVFVPTEAAKIGLAELKSILGLRSDLELRLYQDAHSVWHRRWNAFFTPRRYVLIGGKLVYVEPSEDSNECGCLSSGGEAK